MDLFENYSELPTEVQTAISKFPSEASNSYEECVSLAKRLFPFGYDFEYGLDGVPYDLTAPTHNLLNESEIFYTGTYNLCCIKLGQSQSQSYDYATKYGGWKISPIKNNNSTL